jgi:predicted phosphoribosyltransferase
VLLGRRLEHLCDDRPVVLGMPRGGVAVAAEVAMELGAPLDVVVCRKLGAPWNEEFGFGAVAPDGRTYMDARTVAELGLSPARIKPIVSRAADEVRRCEKLYRAGRKPLDIAGRCAILVDDGLATGVTARAAIRWALMQSPSHLVLAVPVAPPQTLQELAPDVNELVCLRVPRDFQSVGQFYQDFSQVSDERVIELLRLAGKPGRPLFDGPSSQDEMEAVEHEHHSH